MYIGDHVLYPSLSVFNETWIFSKVFRKTLISNFIKVLPVGAKLLHADKKNGWTGRHYEANIRLTPFCESANKVCFYMVVKRTHLGSQDSS